MKTDQSQRPILIFDGHCNLCNGWVTFILKRDRKKRFLFTANQHPAGRQLLEDLGENPEEVSTVYLWYQNKLYTRSTAGLQTLRLLGFPWSLFYGLIIFPRFLRDPFYALIAKNRYKIWGKSDTCRLPSKEEKLRFL